MTALQLPFDFRFAWAGAKLTFPFVRRGIVPEGISRRFLCIFKNSNLLFNQPPRPIFFPGSSVHLELIHSCSRVLLYLPNLRTLKTCTTRFSLHVRLCTLRPRRSRTSLQLTRHSFLLHMQKGSSSTPETRLKKITYSTLVL